MLRGFLSAIGVYEIYRRWLLMQIGSKERPEIQPKEFKREKTQ